MTRIEIIDALKQGKTVHWSNEGYKVIGPDKFGQYFVGWDIGGRRENYIGLETRDGELNGYYIGD